MHCERQLCKQGRECCNRPECGFDLESAIAAARRYGVDPEAQEAQDEPITRPEAMAWLGIEILLGAVVTVFFAVAAHFIWTNWPVISGLAGL